MEAIREGADWFLRLDEGEHLPGTISDWARREGIRAAAILAGIGLVRDTELGYLHGGRYQVQRFEDPLELLNLVGSIAWEDGAPSVHLHLTGSRADHTAVGGHLISTTIGLLAEISVRTFPGRKFRRPMLPGGELRALRLTETPAP